MDTILQVFVSVDDVKSEIWRFRADVFLMQLRNNWPAATIREIKLPKSPYSHDWKVDVGDLSVKGMLDRDGVNVPFEGPSSLCAQFAVWIRSIVPSAVKLKFYDITGDVVLPLAADTQFEQVYEVLAG
jgi:hypothetical protein